MEQQFLQGIQQADFAIHQQQNQMNLLRQMEFLNGQRGAFWEPFIGDNVQEMMYTSP